MPTTDLHNHVTDIRRITEIHDLLYWDERMMQPEAAGDVDERARQRALLVGMQYAEITSDAFLAVLDQAAQALGADHPDVKRAYALRAKELAIGTDLASRIAAQSATTWEAWQYAREHDDPDTALRELSTMRDLQIELAERVGYEHEPYDALLDMWEPRITAQTVEHWLTALDPLRSEIDARHSQVQVAAHEHLAQAQVPPAEAIKLQRELTSLIGFDHDSGRIDPTNRAFCIRISPHDVRMTSRFSYDRRFISLYSILHESGHGIYSQSFDRLGVSPVLSDVAGLGMDETFSRMYENVICRSRRFFELHGQRIQQALGDDTIAVGDLWRAAVGFNFDARRVDADEWTYNFHVDLRFRLERAMINGDLHVRDLPDAWVDLSRELLWSVPRTDRRGFLQDVHWYIGQWGYFPTYFIGNIYGAMIMQAMRRDGVDILASPMQETDFRALRSWCDEHFFRHGASIIPYQQVEAVCAEPISAQPLVAYLTERLAEYDEGWQED